MKNITLLILVSLISLELFSFVATKANLLLFNGFPGDLSNAILGYDWRKQKDPWGSWHKANATDRHQRSCFDVRYHSNEAERGIRLLARPKLDRKPATFCWAIYSPRVMGSASKTRPKHNWKRFLLLTSTTSVPTDI